MHDAVLSSLLAAPMSFYHATPLGRVINRLTKDTSELDRTLTVNAAFALRALLQVVSTVMLIGAIAPFALPALVVVLALYAYLYSLYQVGCFGRCCWFWPLLLCVVVRATAFACCSVLYALLHPP